MISSEPHPLLDLASFTCELQGSAGTASPDWLVDLLRLAAPAPLAADDHVRSTVRDLLRHGGYKPTGRGKPAPEYLIKAAEADTLASINAFVDACNVASLHSGLPISVVDLDLAQAPYSVRLAAAGESYVFNASGQTIELAGLPCLVDADGPCANAVRDSQRTKTRPETRRALYVVWGTTGLPGRAAATATWCRDLLTRAGMTTQD